MSLRVLVNATSARMGAGLVYIGEQLSALERVRPNVTLQVLAAPWNAPELRRAIESEVREVRVRGPLSRVAFEQLRLPATLRTVDVLYCPANFCPLGRTRAPVVLGLQNASYFGRARRLPYSRSPRRRAETALCRWSVRRADAVIVISEALRAEVASDGFPKEKLRVIPYGAPKWPDRGEPPAGLDETAEYILSLGSDYLHKRLDDVVLAWGRAFRSPSRVPKLVMAGTITPKRRKALQGLAPDGRRRDFVFLGNVTDRAVVRWLFEHAMGMVSASEVEAFGLTLSEGGSLGSPLVLSDIPAHREVAGTHATYVPVRDVAALAAALEALPTDTSTRRPWSWPVSWEQNAHELASVFEELSVPSAP